LLDWYAAAARAAVLGNEVEVQQSIVAMLGKRLALGAASSTEENQARIALTQSQVDLARARRQIEEAKSRLAAAIGLPAAALDTIRVRFDEFDRDLPQLDTGTVRRYAVLNRADLLAALSEYAASESALRTEIAKQYPDLQLGPAYTFDMGINKFALGLSSLALPIFNRNEGPIAEARAHRAELAAKFEALQAKVIGEVDQALQADDSARRQLALADSLLEAERSQFERVKRSFAADEVDRLTVALAAHALHAAELAQRDASTRAREAIGELEDAAQRPIVGELTDVDLESAPRGAKP
jgi:outer membrane protein TolC